MVNKIIVDTSALIEYVFATPEGKIAQGIIENEASVIIIPSIVIGEFVSKLKRLEVKNFEEIVDNLGGYSITIPLYWETCFNAGKKHAELRNNKESKDISLIDCIIMEIAKEHGNALILTKDPHFRSYKNARLL